MELPTTRIEANVQAAAYYLLTEAIANAQKHSRASSIRVSVGSRPAGLTVVVEDDGIGGATESVGGGLRGIRERLELLGGTFTVVSPTGGGTRITAVIPTRTL